MRDGSQISATAIPGFLQRSVDNEIVESLVRDLRHDGIALLPQLVSPAVLQNMQHAFEARLRYLRWNNVEGYIKTEPYRHMVEDVLVLDQGFIDLVLHPLIKEVLNAYLGDDYELTEAKGWKSLPTRRDFHGWHGDAWYDQDIATEIHKEVKLAIYLTDVRSGAFNFIKGSHRKQHPRLVKNSEVDEVPRSQVTELPGSAGTAFLFDTSGIHRQGVPMLEERQACFFNYHNPNVDLQREDLDYYRYHPLILNAAFLGDLSAEDRRILGFGNKTRFRPGFIRDSGTLTIYQALNVAHDVQLKLRSFNERIAARVKRMLG